ncbi:MULTISPECIES: hypothetical protein [Bacteria]|uniref:hypothetical protein n=1 Tax=Bacteria TaxID=2 RepID=UPI003C7C46EA
MNAFKKGLVTTAAVFAVAVPLAAMTPAMAAPVEGQGVSASAGAHGAKTVWNDVDYLKNHTEGSALRDHLRALGFQADLFEKGSWVYLSYDENDADLVRAIQQYQPKSPVGSEGEKDTKEPVFEKHAA